MDGPQFFVIVLLYLWVIHISCTKGRPSVSVCPDRTRPGVGRSKTSVIIASGYKIKVSVRLRIYTHNGAVKLTRDVKYIYLYIAGPLLLLNTGAELEFNQFLSFA